MQRTKILLLLLLAGAVALFFALGLQHHLSLDALRASQARLMAWHAEAPLTVMAAFFVAYVVVTALSLPGAVVMTLAAGAAFGLWWGTVLVSFASTLGATLAMLTARFLLRDSVFFIGRYVNPEFSPMSSAPILYPLMIAGGTAMFVAGILSLVIFLRGVKNA